MTTYTEQDRKHWAKAAGFQIEVHETIVGSVSWIHLPSRKEFFRRWKPDTSKADCFELLEALQRQGTIAIFMSVDDRVVVACSNPETKELKAETLQEAICTLAAEIGRKMEESE